MLGGIVIEEKPAGNGVKKADTAMKTGTVQKSSTANKVGTVNKAGVAKTSGTVRKTAPIKKTGTAGKGVSSLLIVIVAIILVVAAVGAAVLFMGGSGKSAPVANFKADVTSGVAPLTVHFTDLSKNSPDEWLWDFGDGKSSQEQNPAHQYTAAGSYTVSLTVSNSDGSDDEVKEAYITVSAAVLAPVADFSAAPLSGLAPLTVQFTDKSTNTPTSWSWNFGDGATSTDQNPSHQYTVPGTYAVSLTATNAAGSDTATETAFITVKEAVLAPSAGFSADVTSGDAPLTVHFSDESTNAPASWLWNFGDGTTSSEQDPSHQYTTPGVYTVTLTVTNSAGTDSKVKEAYINVTTASEGDLLYVGNGTAVTVIGYTGPGGKVMIPSYIDGLPVTAIGDQAFRDCTTLTSVTIPGTVTAIGDRAFEGCSALASMTFLGDAPTVGSDWVQGCPVLTVYYLADASGFTTPTWNGVPCYPLSAPSAAFAADPVSGYAPLTVHFTDSSTGASSWFWDFGDGTNSTERNPSHQYTVPGTYAVSLTVTSSAGTDTATETITVTDVVPAPAADFSADVTSGDAPLTVKFTDLSANGPISWLWNFGDGTNSTEQNPSHQYTAPGTYTVKLTVSNSAGNDTEVKIDYITVREPVAAPSAGFEANITSGIAPLAIKFTDLSGNTPTSWFWDFGDGTNSTERNATHIYNVVGTFTVTLTVTNSAGNDTEIKIDYISITAPPKPSADFKADKTAGYAPKVTVQFTDNSTGIITSWFWDFGDGTNSTERNPSHEYTVPGVYDVSLKVTNAGGSDFKNVTGCIKVQLPPKADFIADPVRGTASLTVTFTDNSTNDPQGWAWDFDNDGDVDSYDQNPTHTYKTPGTYTVTLAVWNNIGGENRMDTKVRESYIVVLPVPTVAFSADIASGIAPLTVQFTDTSTWNPTAWQWDFGDGCISNQSSSRHVYTSPGTYNVTLTAWNADGNGTLRKNGLINVIQDPDRINWTQWQRDAAHTGVMYWDSMPDNVTRLWSNATGWAGYTGAQINSQPIVAGNKVFILTSDEVVAMDRTTGEILWRAAVGSGFENGLIAYGDGKVFVATQNGTVYGLSEVTGSPIWKYTTRPERSDPNYKGFASPITYYDGRLYICERNYGISEDKLMYCFDKNGVLQWSRVFDDTGVIWSGPVVVGDYLVCHSYESGILQSYDRIDGTPVDRFSLKSNTSIAREDLGRLRSSSVYHDGYIYQTSECDPDGYLFKVRFQDGRFIDDETCWSVEIGFSTSTPVIYDGRIYVGWGEHGDDLGGIQCLDDADGRVIWWYNISAGVKSSPAVVVTDDGLYVLFTGNAYDGADQELYCIYDNGINATLRWSWNPPDENSYILQGGTPSDGRVYFGNHSGWLYCLGSSES